MIAIQYHKDQLDLFYDPRQPDLFEGFEGYWIGCLFCDEINIRNLVDDPALINEIAYFTVQGWM